MKKKWWLTVMIGLVLLAGMSMAEYAVTTADGIGADGGVSNDTNQQDTWLGGATGSPEIRRFDGTRAKAAILRFDIGSGVGGDRSGASLSITEISGNRTRTMNIYGLNDSAEDFWDEATLSYNTAPGLLNPETDGYLTIDTTKWTLVGTMPFLDVRNSGPTVITGLIDNNFIASDTNGAVTLLLFTATSDQDQSYYVAMKENTGGYAYPTLTFPNARFATDPVPANGQSVLTALNQLNWSNTEPNAPSGVISCDVYIGTSEPNAAQANYGMTKIASGTTSTTVTIPFALTQQRYYWLVDSYDSSTDPAYLGTGATWYFDASSAPQINDDPDDQILTPGQTAQFTVSVASDTPVQYNWYQSADLVIGDDTAVGTNSDTLTLISVSGTNEGYYYCKAVNASGQANAVYSAMARLVVQRQVAHWTLDTLVGGQYADSSGEGHPADPNNTNVTFTDGVNSATTAQGVLINDNSFATAGTWNPSYVSGEFTLSFWMKWDGTGSGFRGLLSKHNGWAAANTLWQFGIDSSDRIAMIRANGTNVYGQTVPANEWLYVAVTFNGSTAAIYTFQPGSGSINFTTASGAYTLGTKTDADFNIGCSYVNTAGAAVERFPGVLDEIQVFNYVKDVFALADLYNEAVSQDFCLLEYGSSEIDLDVNGNCRIDLPDFAEFAKDWLACGLYPNCP